ncbi:MAG: hypothetical protein QW666_00190 [Candidatus Woesearchaeota archaeon]
MNGRDKTQIQKDLAALLNQLGNTSQIQQLQAQLAQMQNTLAAEQAAKTQLQTQFAQYQATHTYDDNQYRALEAAKLKAEHDCNTLKAANQQLTIEKQDLTDKVTLYQNFEAALRAKLSGSNPPATP